MKIYIKYKIIYFLFFIICCEQTVITNPPDNMNLSYKVNLKRENIIGDRNSVTISWNKYNKEDFLNYTISNGADDSIIDDVNLTNFNIDMNHGEFKKIYFKINTNNQIFQDSIQVFSDIIKPIIWDDDPIEWVSPDTNILNWNYQINNDITKIEIYRSQSLDQAYKPELNLYSANPGEDWELRPSLSLGDTIYVDLKSDSNPMYIYVIKISDSNNNFRYSTIKRDVSSFTYGLNDKTYTLNATGSNSIKSKVYISWDSYLDSDFYQYLIWRSIDGEFDYDSTKTLIAIIAEPSISYFEDRDSIYVGRSYYYQIELMGKYHDKAQKKEKIEGKIGL